MTIEHTPDGTPYLSDQSYLSETPPYTQELAQHIDALGTSIETVSGVPVGSIMMWMSKQKVPDGWLPLDGSVTDLSPYPILAGLFGGSLPDFGARTPLAGIYETSNSSIGNLQDYKMSPNQLVTHQHDLTHTHITDVGRDHQGATTLTGSPHPVNGSFPIESRGPSQTLTNQSVYQNGTPVVDAGNGGLVPIQYHVWTLFIIKHD